MFFRKCYKEFQEEKKLEKKEPRFGIAIVFTKGDDDILDIFVKNVLLR